MRLSPAKIGVSRQAAGHSVGARAEVRLSASCVDDVAWGGEVLPLHALAGHLKSGASIQRGFTLVELVTIMVVLGIMAAVAVPRLFDRGLFDSRGYYDQVTAALRYAQKTAISQRRLVCVTFPTASRMVLQTAASFGAAGCATDLQSPDGNYPAGQTTYTVDAPSGVTLGGAVAFNFDALGRPSFAGSVPLAIAVSGYAASNICIAAETGYVYGKAIC